MKKICLCCLLLFCVSFGLFAASEDDVTFREYVELTRKSPTNPKGMTVTADYEKNIIYCAVPAPGLGTVTDAEKKQMKEQMLKTFRENKADVRVVKRLKISIVFVFITDSDKMLTISISHNEI